MNNAKLWVILGILTIPSQAVAAEPSIELLGVTLTVGESQSKIIKELDGSSDYALQCVDRASSSLTKCASILIYGTSERHRVYGDLYFTRHKLDRVAKYWYSGSPSSGNVGDFVKSLYSLMKKFSNGHPTHMTLQTISTDKPGVEDSGVLISKGRKTIQLHVTKSLNSQNDIPPHWITLMETIN